MQLHDIGSTVLALEILGGRGGWWLTVTSVVAGIRTIFTYLAPGCWAAGLLRVDATHARHRWTGSTRERQLLGIGIVAVRESRWCALRCPMAVRIKRPGSPACLLCNTGMPASSVRCWRKVVGAVPPVGAVGMSPGVGTSTFKLFCSHCSTCRCTEWVASALLCSDSRTSQALFQVLQRRLAAQRAECEVQPCAGIRLARPALSVATVSPRKSYKWQAGGPAVPQR